MKYNSSSVSFTSGFCRSSGVAEGEGAAACLVGLWLLVAVVSVMIWINYHVVYGLWGFSVVGFETYHLCFVILIYKAYSFSNLPWILDWCMKLMCFVMCSEFSRAEVTQGTIGLEICFKKLTEHTCDGTAWTGDQVSCAALPKGERNVMGAIRTMHFILCLEVLTVATCNYMEPTFWFLLCFLICFCSFKNWNAKGKGGTRLLDFECRDTKISVSYILEPIKVFSKSA